MKKKFKFCRKKQTFKDLLLKFIVPSKFYNPMLLISIEVLLIYAENR